MNLSELAPKAAEAERFLKALGNQHRLMILCELHNGEAGVSELQRALGLSQSSLSQHLARLRRDRLVKTVASRKPYITRSPPPMCHALLPCSRNCSVVGIESA